MHIGVWRSSIFVTPLQWQEDVFSIMENSLLAAEFHMDFGWMRSFFWSCESQLQGSSFPLTGTDCKHLITLTDMEHGAFQRPSSQASLPVPNTETILLLPHLQVHSHSERLVLLGQSLDCVESWWGSLFSVLSLWRRRLLSGSLLLHHRLLPSASKTLKYSSNHRNLRLVSNKSAHG